ncbi:MAG: DUF2778 domain-containing protein [Pseudomonadales bacterium]|jgi:hypothetical protein|nr:DUF2778 domain-containing protein [Pseudomonadales bacterium]
MATLHFYSTYDQLLVMDRLSGSYFVRATSGKGDCINVRSCESTGNTGPIPSGRYYLYKSEISDPNFFWDVGRNVLADWGDWRVRLHPLGGIRKYGRDDFFLHCGSFEGSAGCIDIGGGLLGSSDTNKVLKSIMRDEVSELWVA